MNKIGAFDFHIMFTSLESRYFGLLSMTMQILRHVWRDITRRE